MIGVYVKIPFHAQIKRADPRLASELAEVARAAAASYAAVVHPADESFLLAFDRRSRPSRLRAAEAARFLATRLEGLAPRLHGWAVVVDEPPPPAEDALRAFKRLWYGIPSEGLYLGAAAVQSFSRYFRVAAPEASADRARAPGQRGRCLPVAEILYAGPALPAAIELDPLSATLVDLLVDEIGSLGIGAGTFRSLAVVGPGRSALAHLDAALSRLYPDSAGAFARMRASEALPSPYGPVIEALGSAASGKAGAFVSGAERAILEELRPILDFLGRSPFRTSFSPGLGVRLRICAATAFRLYAREKRAASMPAFIVVEGLDLLSPESVGLVKFLAEGPLAEEGITVLAAGRAVPEGWPDSGAKRVSIPEPGPKAIRGWAVAAADGLARPDLVEALAAGTAADPFRLAALSRLAASGLDPAPLAESPTPELGSAALSTYPEEFAELLLALRSCEGVLTDADLEDFLDSMGYVAGLRPLAYKTLADLGFVVGGPRPRIALEARARGVEAALEDGGAAFGADLARRLIALHGARKIVPSLALYRRIRRIAAEPGSSPALLLLLLDCIAADSVHGMPAPADQPDDAAPLAGVGDFLAAYERGDGAASLRELERLEASLPGRAGADPSSAAAGTERISACAVALLRASRDYAERAPQAAAARAKSALIGLHADGARRSEARALRLLGLCSLAQAQIQEGADYLANAYEVGESLADPLECILAAQAEASALLVIGDLARASARIAAGASWARSSFRADWEAAFAFMEARVAFELGRYAAAEEAFGRVRSLARIYGYPEAADRAELWTGRSAAWAGEAERGREILSRRLSDPEASWFLAELSLWEGSTAEAAALASRAAGSPPPRGFYSADSFRWDSGFAAMEERALGFSGPRGYLEDQILAFADFALGMAGDSDEAERRAGALAVRAREERLASHHPTVHLYLFYAYLLLDRAGRGTMDGATALSKAFKSLQIRAARMGDPETKLGFLEANRWNKKLFAEARLRKLI